MKIVMSILIALSVLAGVAVSSANALDPKTFYEEMDRQSGGG